MKHRQQQQHLKIQAPTIVIHLPQQKSTKKFNTSTPTIDVINDSLSSTSGYSSDDSQPVAKKLKNNNSENVCQSTSTSTMPKTSTILKTSSGTYVGSVSPPSPAIALRPQSSNVINGSLYLRVMITTSLKNYWLTKT